MHTLRIICSILLIAEFIMAPINLWTGKTMPNFTAFTGLSPAMARTIFAPLKLVGALLLIAGFWQAKIAAAGAGILGFICLVYLVRLSGRDRRDPSGIGAFAFGLACAAIVFFGSI